MQQLRLIVGVEARRSTAGCHRVDLRADPVARRDRYAAQCAKTIGFGYADSAPERQPLNRVYQ